MDCAAAKMKEATPLGNKYFGTMQKIAQKS
jgi:hypothetical protein